MDHDFEKEKNQSDADIENNEQKAKIDETDETEELAHNQQEKMENQSQSDELEKNQTVFNDSKTEEKIEKKETLHRKNTQSNFIKSNLMTAIVVGIISSLLTLTIVFYTPLFQNKLTDQTSENSGSSLVDKDLTPSEQTTEGVTTNKSLVNMIENT